MNETVTARAVRLLREAADAYEAVPGALRSINMFGGAVILTPSLRQEADRIEARMEAYEIGSRPAL